MFGVPTWTRAFPGSFTPLIAQANLWMSRILASQKLSAYVRWFSKSPLSDALCQIFRLAVLSWTLHLRFSKPSRHPPHWCPREFKLTNVKSRLAPAQISNLACTWAHWDKQHHLWGSSAELGAGCAAASPQQAYSSSFCAVGLPRGFRIAAAHWGKPSPWQHALTFDRRMTASITLNPGYQAGTSHLLPSYVSHHRHPYTRRRSYL